MRKSLFFLSLLLCGLLFLCGCEINPDESSVSEVSVSELSSQPAEENSEPEITGWPVTVEGVTLEAAPEQVAVLSPSLAEIICDLGYETRISAVGECCDTPSALSELPECGTLLSPELSLLLEIKPQYLISSAPLSASNTESLNQAGITVLVFAPAETWEELELLYTNLGLFFGGELEGLPAAEAYYDSCLNLLNAAADAVKPYTNNAAPPSLLYLRMGKRTVATPDTFEGSLISYLGFRNAVSAFLRWDYSEAETEPLNPDIILLDISLSAEEIRQDILYCDSPAAARNLLVSLDMSLMERQSKRAFTALAEAMQQLAFLERETESAEETE